MSGKIIVLLLAFLIFTPVFSTVVKADTTPPLAIDQAHLDSISQTLRQKIHVTHHSPGQMPMGMLTITYTDGSTIFRDVFRIITLTGSNPFVFLLGPPGEN